MKDTHTRFWAGAGIIAASLLLFGRTLDYPLLFDDFIYLLENPLACTGHSFGYPFHFQTFATSSLRMGLDPDLSVNFILRPFAYLTFYLNYLIDGWNPTGLRLVNILIHGANALFIWKIIRHLILHSPKEIGDRPFASEFIGLATALLFLVHPLALESVTYVVQRFTSLGTLFYLIVLYTHFRATTSSTTQQRRLWKSCSLVSLVVGMLTKEILFTAPFLVIVIEYLVMGARWRLAIRRSFHLFCCLPIIPGLMLLTSSALSADGLKMASVLFVADPHSSFASQYQYALTETAVVVTYLRMVLLPYGQNLDPDFPLIKSFWDLRVLGSLSIIAAAIGATGWWFWQCKRDLRRSLLFCGVIWFFLALSIDSTVVPLPDVMAEHRSYLPSIGLLLALVSGLDGLRSIGGSRRSYQMMGSTVIVCWVLALSTALIMREEVWSSEVAMWKDVAAKSPNKARVWMNLGTSYHRAHRKQEALRCFIRFVQLRPDVPAGYINVAAAQEDLGQYRKAIKTVSVGLSLGHSAYESRLYYTLGRIWSDLGDIQKSIQCSEIVIRLAPQNADAHWTLMRLYARLQDYRKALYHGQIAASLLPNDHDLAREVATVTQSAATTGDL